jgi:hypothetical protein
MFGSQNLQSPSQQKITIDKTTEVVCENCKGNIFTEAVFIRRVSPLVSGQPKDGYIPIATFVCIKCNTANDCFIPEDLKNKIKLV